MPRKSPDIILIGGGVIGLTIARRFAKEGLSVALLEASQIGREASWAGAGVLAPPNPHRKDAVAELQLRSLAMYPAFCAELMQESGIDPEYEPCGELEVAFDEAGLQVLREDERAACGRRTPDGRPAYEVYSAEKLRHLEPVVSPQVVGALECREASQVRNPRLLRALQTACRRMGVELCENTPVRDFEVEGGRVTGVRIDRDTVAATHVVLCAGAWSSRIGEQLKGIMPVHPVHGQMVLMKLDRRPFDRIIARGKTYLVPRRDGHILLGATEEPEAGFTKRNTAGGIAGLKERAVRMAPRLAEAPVAAMWSGLRPGTPDDMPYIGPVPGLKGLIAATGHYRTGLSLAPATAEVVASMILERAYDLDLTCCLPGR